MEQIVTFKVGISLEQRTTDMCLCIKHTDGNVTIFRIYVDDLLVTGTSTDIFDEFFESMVSLEIKDLGVVNKFLGPRIIEVTIDSLLSDHGLSSANGVRSSIGEECNNVDMLEPELLGATA